MSLTAAVQCHEHDECDQHTVKTSQELAQPSADDSDEDLDLRPDDVNGKILHENVFLMKYNGLKEAVQCATICSIIKQERQQPCS